MMSTSRVLSPASGEPIIVPSQDVVLGIYYMTREKLMQKVRGAFADVEECNAYHSKNVELQARVKVELGISERNGNRQKIFDTTVGRHCFTILSLNFLLIWLTRLWTKSQYLI